MARQNRVVVRVDELIERINEVLRKEDKKVRRTRSQSDMAFDQLGEFHMIETQRKQIIERHVDLEALGRERGVLKPNEMLVGE